MQSSVVSCVGDEGLSYRVRRTSRGLVTIAVTIPPVLFQIISIELLNHTIESTHAPAIKWFHDPKLDTLAFSSIASVGSDGGSGSPDAPPDW